VNSLPPLELGKDLDTVMSTPSAFRCQELPDVIPIDEVDYEASLTGRNMELSPSFTSHSTEFPSVSSKETDSALTVFIRIPPMKFNKRGLVELEFDDGFQESQPVKHQLRKRWAQYGFAH